MAERNIICFGEILWDLLPEGKKVGGAPLNVCYHLNRNGIKSQMVSQVGFDALGEELLKKMDEMGVDRSLCSQSVQYPTSTVEVSLDENGNARYSIVQNVAWDYIKYSSVIADSIRISDAIVIGSLIARNEISRNTLFQCLDFAKEIVLDINLRSPYFEEETIHYLLSKCHILKINEDELFWLASSFGWENNEETILKNILGKFDNIKEILLTKGEQGSVFCNNEKYLSFPAHPIQVEDTVGSGDSFLASYLTQRMQGNSIEECMEYATLVSAYVATRKGACPNYTLQDIENFKQTLQV